MKGLWISLFIIISYLLGSIPNGYIVPKIFKKIDIRQHNSKNVGATNVVRTCGLAYGLLVFFLDVLKGFIVIFIIRILLYYDVSFAKKIGLIDAGLTKPMIFYPIYGVFAGLGHVFPIFLNFKGGKAVATCWGATLAIAPIISIIGITIFLIVFLLLRYASLASIYGTLSTGIILFFYDVFLTKDSNKFYIYDYHPNNWLIYLFEYGSVLLMVGLIILRHRKNLDRLAKGNERRF